MSAPYKKKKDKSRVPCIFYQKGSCTNQRCQYLHVRGKADAVGRAGTIEAPSSDSGGGAATNLLSTMLRLVFEKQQQRVYDAATGMLDLSELATLPDLRDVVGSINFNTHSFCGALCATIKSLITPPPTALQLRGNDIASLFHLAGQLAKAGLHLPLRAISLERNRIKALDFVQELKEFRNLQELVLVGNPVAQRADYRAEVKKKMPFLLGLDGAALVATPLALPWPRMAGAAEYGDAARHVLQFVQCSLLGPLEADGAAGGPRGVDAVSDVYAHNAVLTISLSSPEAAVSVPVRASGGGSVAAQPRSEIVAMRLKQTESNHNLLHGVKSAVVACGRTKVCAQLEHWLYPRRFDVQHCVHGSAGVAFLDNTGLGAVPGAVMKVPLTAVTLHGVMQWSHRGAPAGGDHVVIQRNFTRVLTVLQGEAGRWLVANDMVSLHPFTGGGDGGDAVAASAGLDEARVLFSPRTDRTRAERLGRQKNVPALVVTALGHHVGSDAELLAVLADLDGVPIGMYEHCAALAGDNALDGIQVCRIGNRYGLAPNDGLDLLRRAGGNWCSVEEIMAASQL